MARKIEKREYNRIKPINFFIEYKYRNDNTVFKVPVINIGAAGLCFIRNSIISKGDIVKIKFPFRTKKILLDAKVMRVDGREVALKFLNSDQEIQKFVETFNLEYPAKGKKERKPDQRLSTEKKSEEKITETSSNILDIE
jgi:hypothetical protein